MNRHDEEGGLREDQEDQEEDGDEYSRQSKHAVSDYFHASMFSGYESIRKNRAFQPSSATFSVDDFDPSIMNFVSDKAVLPDTFQPSLDEWIDQLRHL